MEIVYYITAILVFTIFDIVGYYYILTKKETKEPLKADLYFYRFLQVSFQAVICAVLFLIDYKIMLAFLISWWFGLCDLLYYWLRGYWIKSTNMFWLWWTPYGMILGLLKKKIDYRYLIVFSLLSLIGGIWMNGK